MHQMLCSLFSPAYARLAWPVAHCWFASLVVGGGSGGGGGGVRGGDG